MANYEILLFKGKEDRAKNKIFKRINFSGRYIDALRRGHVLSEQEKCKDFDVPIASSSDAYKEFIKRFQILTEKNKEIVVNTLSNIFTMRLIGNKTHGDLAEVGIAEFINQYMYDYSGQHVGKDLYRAKGHEEDIIIASEINDIEIPVSLKAYGDGPLQLSTDKDSMLWVTLTAMGDYIDNPDDLHQFLTSPIIQDVFTLNIMPLIYRESTMECNILIFDSERALNDVAKIVKVEGDEGVGKGKGRMHPIYKFLNEAGEYICEVRYGGKTANALQRGLWTHTKHAYQYFHSATNGWINYKHNNAIIELIRLALNSSPSAHVQANLILLDDIKRIKKNGKI